MKLKTDLRRRKMNSITRVSTKILIRTKMRVRTLIKMQIKFKTKTKKRMRK